VATDVVAMLFDDAENLSAQTDDLKDKREANRDALRTIARAGGLTPEQVEKMNTYYPPRKKRGSQED
jgi:phosphoribosylanthranilate isomerase